jgi:hypothetical protein
MSGFWECVAGHPHVMWCDVIWPILWVSATFPVSPSCIYVTPILVSTLVLHGAEPHLRSSHEPGGLVAICCSSNQKSLTIRFCCFPIETWNLCNKFSSYRTEQVWVCVHYLHQQISGMKRSMVPCESHKKRVNAVCGQYVELLFLLKQVVRYVSAVP